MRRSTTGLASCTCPLRLDPEGCYAQRLSEFRQASASTRNAGVLPTNADVLDNQRAYAGDCHAFRLRFPITLPARVVAFMIVHVFNGLQHPHAHLSTTAAAGSLDPLDDRGLDVESGWMRATRPHLNEKASWKPPVAWISLAALTAQIFFCDDATPFPGWAATIPVFRTAAVILDGAGCTTGGTVSLLSVRPMA